MPRWIDAHVHLDLWAEGLEAELQLALERGLVGCILPGAYPSARRGESCTARLQAWLQQTFPACFCVAGEGLHPYALAAWAEQRGLQLSESEGERLAEHYVSELHELLQIHGLGFVGECGLDALRSGLPSLKLQTYFLEAQLALAADLHLPCVLHSLRTQAEVLALARGLKWSRLMVHGFGGSYEEGQIWLKHGFVLGLGPALLDPKRRRLQEAARRLPVSAFLLESDAPQLHKDFTAERELLVGQAVLQRLSQLRGEPEPELAEALLQQTLAFFGVTVGERSHLL